MQERTSRGALRGCCSVFGCQTQREDVALGVGDVGEDDAGLDFARLSDNLAASTDDRFASERKIIDDEMQSGAATASCGLALSPRRTPAIRRDDHTGDSYWTDASNAPT